MQELVHTATRSASFLVAQFSLSVFFILFETIYSILVVYTVQVLMQTGDAELEMRGRCSAGQKVKSNHILLLIPCPFPFEELLLIL